MTAEQRKRLFEVRRILDETIEGMGLTDEAAFNEKAAEVNDKAAALRIWRADEDYRRGDVRIDPADGAPYWAMHDHGPASGQVHRPGESPTIWTHCHGTTAETARPFVAEGHNPYRVGHCCAWEEGVYRCGMDGCVWSPGEYPEAWEKVN